MGLRHGLRKPEVGGSGGAGKAQVGGGTCSSQTQVRSGGGTGEAQVARDSAAPHVTGEGGRVEGRGEGAVEVVRRRETRT